MRKEEVDGVDLQRGFSGKMTLMADDAVMNAPLGPWPLLLRWVRDAQATTPLHHVATLHPAPNPVALANMYGLGQCAVCAG
eukprot:COSAG05_NODE_742_length_7592_cov_2.844922_4_plen_81_part_00